MGRTSYLVYFVSKPKDRIYVEELFRILASVIALSLNITQIILISKMKRKKTIYEFFLLSLAISDGLFVAFNIVFSVVTLAELYHLFEYVILFYFVSIATSTLHLLAIAFDRTGALYFPVRHKVYTTLSSAKMVVTGLWLVMVIIFAVLVILMNQNVNIIDVVINDVVVGPIIYVATLIYTILYGLVIYKLIQTSKKSKERQSTNGSIKSSKDKASVLLCVLTTVCFISCSIPIALNLGKYVPDYYSTMLFVINAGINSILFFFRGKFRSYFLAKSTTPTQSTALGPPHHTSDGSSRLKESNCLHKLFRCY